MSVSLNPITQQKLDQFDRRRRRLVLTRGICSGLVSFLLLMTLIATADWLWVLPNSARWAMSCRAMAQPSVLSRSCMICRSEKGRLY